jgi:murein DD-endopeptidase MepM/ murein hydrolase activator NlpD
MLIGAIIAAASVGIGAALLREAAPPEVSPPAASEEPLLGDGIPTRPARSRPPASSRKQAPVVVDVLPPGQEPHRQGDVERGPPRHIAKENVRLRRELAHLRALQAERQRVSQTLTSAGTGGALLFGSGRLIWPISGPLTSPFGQRWGRLHAGIDISAPAGTPISAADSGRVALAGWQGGYGLYSCVQHTATLSTCYAHQSRLATTAGASVRQGQVIGFVGNTGYSFGDHLHFETWVGGSPVDPMGFL